MTNQSDLTSHYPKVRRAFGMDISSQDYRCFAGLPDTEALRPFSCIFRGEWSDNWVPDFDPSTEQRKK